MSREQYQPPAVTSHLSNPANAQGHAPNGAAVTHAGFNITGVSGSDSALEDTSRPVKYLCGDCDAAVQLKRGDPIRCKECGYRVLYKERTTRCLKGALFIRRKENDGLTSEGLAVLGWFNLRHDEGKLAAGRLCFQERKSKRMSVKRDQRDIDAPLQMSVMTEEWTARRITESWRGFTLDIIRKVGSANGMISEESKVRKGRFA
nr:dna-directed rna polymerases i, ii, and iii subunit rpabc4 [Quercus suber]